MPRASLFAVLFVLLSVVPSSAFLSRIVITTTPHPTTLPRTVHQVDPLSFIERGMSLLGLDPPSDGAVAKSAAVSLLLSAVDASLLGTPPNATWLLIKTLSAESLFNGSAVDLSALLAAKNQTLVAKLATLAAVVGGSSFSSVADIPLLGVKDAVHSVGQLGTLLVSVLDDVANLTAASKAQIMSSVQSIDVQILPAILSVTSANVSVKVAAVGAVAELQLAVAQELVYALAVPIQMSHVDVPPSANTSVTCFNVSSGIKANPMFSPLAPFAHLVPLLFVRGLPWLPSLAGFDTVAAPVLAVVHKGEDIALGAIPKIVTGTVGSVGKMATGGEFLRFAGTVTGTLPGPVGLLPSLLLPDVKGKDVPDGPPPPPPPPPAATMVPKGGSFLKMPTMPTLALPSLGSWSLGLPKF